MRVFITGLTGTLGTALARLHHSRGDAVFGCARSESRGVAWLRENAGLGTLFLQDADRLRDPASSGGVALPSMDRLYHLAAMKHVDQCEADPYEACLQNVRTALCVLHACAEAEGVPCVFASTDKAFRPEGVYGATKLLAEKIVLREGGAVVRLGNLIGSSGSVFEAWADALARGEPLKLTDPQMTRFFITREDAAGWMADRAIPGEVRWPVLRSAVMGEVAERLAGLRGGRVEVVGARPGESRHQYLSEWCGSADAPRWDTDELLREAGVLEGGV